MRRFAAILLNIIGAVVAAILLVVVLIWRDGFMHDRWLLAALGSASVAILVYIGTRDIIRFCREYDDEPEAVPGAASVANPINNALTTQEGQENG